MSIGLYGETVIKTDNSFLDVYQGKHNEEFKLLVKSCIEDIKNKLIIKPVIKLYGKIYNQPRDVGFFSDSSIGYRYSGQLAKSQELTSNLKKLIEYMNNMFNANFNGILINRYNSGLEYISKHSDDEYNLDDIGVVAISYGTERKFRIRNKVTNEKILDIPTKSYSIIHMSKNFQKEFTHEIPKETKISNSRYSLTFRHHLE
jgi:alkylated DNA repair dioxygenase AlkB